MGKKHYKTLDGNILHFKIPLVKSSQVNFIVNQTMQLLRSTLKLRFSYTPMCNITPM